MTHVNIHEEQNLLIAAMQRQIKRQQTELANLKQQIAALRQELAKLEPAAPDQIAAPPLV